MELLDHSSNQYISIEGRMTILTIHGHRLSEWRAYAQHDADQNVLEAGKEKKGRILRIDYVTFLSV